MNWSRYRNRSRCGIAQVGFLCLLVFSAGVTAGEEGDPPNRVVFVDADAPGANDGSSWSDAFHSPQDALATVRAGDEIRVAQGTYRPDSGAGGTRGDRTATFQLVNGVAIKGGYAGFGETDPDARSVKAHETILSGDLNGDDGSNFAGNRENSYHVVTGSGLDRTAVLDGLTITAGNANDPYGAFSGGGMYSKYGGSPTVSHCVFKRNSARSLGGGVYVAMYSDPVLSHCAFIGNRAGGGGGLHSSGGTEQNICETTLINCLFSGNLATGQAGGIDNSGILTLIGCTLSGNSGEKGVGGMFDFFGKATLSNCILWGNTGSATGESAQIHNYTQYVGDTDINYCCVQGWTGTFGGVGNIGGNPLLVDPDGGDNVFGTRDDNPRLRPNSSCLDAGDSTALSPEMLNDLDGNPRLVDDPHTADTGNGSPPMVDMGAYEGVNQCFLLSTESIAIPEGQTAPFAVSMAMNPGATVDVAVCRFSGDQDITVTSGSSLTFTPHNYSTPQAVTLAAAEDVDNLHNSALVQVSAEGWAAAGVSVTEEDNDPIPSILYVDADAPGLNDGVSWEDAYLDLQDALRIARAFSHVAEIRVAAGVYLPAGPEGSRDASFQLIRGVTIKGGYAGHGEPNPNRREVDTYRTVLSGDLDRDDIPVENPIQFAHVPWRMDNSHHVLSGSGTDNTAVLDGFSITAGDGTGGGMYNRGGSPTVVNCAFSWNGGSCDSSGGGMANHHDSNPVLVNCTFSHNGASWPGGGAMDNSYGSSPTLLNCALIANKSGGTDGGAAGAIRNWESSNPTLINCLFIGNAAEGLAGAMRSSGNYITNASSPTAINCVFVGNGAEGKGAAVVQERGALTLINCILWGNAGTGPEIRLCGGYQVGATANISYCDIEGGQGGLLTEAGCTLNWGAGNLDVDPRFVDADGPDNVFGTEDDDLHLLPDSMCIDAGDNSAATVPADLDGNPRFVDDPYTTDTGAGVPPIVDMGAYEFARPTSPTNPLPLVAKGALWRYLDDGSDQRTAWRDAAFDDSGWASGPAELGYGDGDEATVLAYGPDAKHKHITTYFRKTFDVPEPEGVALLTLALLRDDGAVVYLNGVEALRTNMHGGRVRYKTRARHAVGGSQEGQFLQHALDPALLVDGRNTLAVEIHQVRGSSSDISFDCELAATLRWPPDTWSVSGRARYHGPRRGDIRIEAFGGPHGVNRIGETQIPGPGPYTISALPAGGDYWIRAYLDGNGNGRLDRFDPVGAYRHNPLRDISADRANIDIRLRRSRCHGNGEETDVADAVGVDSDGDGMSDDAEWRAGTHALETADVFEIISVERSDGPSDEVVIRWAGVEGKRYTVRGSTDLGSGFEVLATDVPGVSPITSFTNRSHRAGPTFFRVETR